MHTPSFLVKMLSSATVVAALAGAPALAMAQTSYAKDTTVVMSGLQFVIRDGSAYESLSSDNESLTVTVPEGRAFELRSRDGRPALENTAGIPACDVLKDLTNRIIVNGPQTVTIRPSTFACSSGAYDTDTTPSYIFSSPSGGSTVTAGEDMDLYWSMTGRASHHRIRLSLDGGKTYDTLVTDDVPGAGYYRWSVPASLASSAQARLLIEGIEYGSVIGFSVSQAFTIDGDDFASAGSGSGNGGLVVKPYDYEADEETRTAATIGVDLGLVEKPSAQICHPDSRIKAKGNPAVYYCGADGKRYVFPNFATYQSWYGSDFNGVMELEPSDVQRIPLGGNVTYRPGTRMLKIQSAPEVFAVAADGTLRYVSQAAAVRLYGANWNKMIDDLPDAFFTNYRIGSPILE